jgi:hypothetical protein
MVFNFQECELGTPASSITYETHSNVEFPIETKTSISDDALNLLVIDSCFLIADLWLTPEVADDVTRTSRYLEFQYTVH